MQIRGETTILLVCAYSCVHLSMYQLSTAFLQALVCIFFANELGGWALQSYSLHASESSALAFVTKRACKRPQVSFSSFRLSLLK